MRSNLRGFPSSRGEVELGQRPSMSQQSSLDIGSQLGTAMLRAPERRSGAGRRPNMTDNPTRTAETGHVSQTSQCGARTRSGAPCKLAPVTGRRRCRMLSRNRVESPFCPLIEHSSTLDQIFGAGWIRSAGRPDISRLPQRALKVRPARSFRRLRNAGPISAPGVQVPPSPCTSCTRQRALSAIILLVEP
jgi:hypothetical protein